MELGKPCALARYSYVAPAGEDAVLKVTPPEDDESDEEADALERWSGDGAVRLLRRDHARLRSGRRRRLTAAWLASYFALPVASSSRMSSLHLASSVDLL